MPMKIASMKKEKPSIAKPSPKTPPNVARRPPRGGYERRMRFRGPLSQSYPAAVALVLLALTPYLVLTTSIQPLQELFAKDTGLSAQALELTSGMANAAYAFGTVLAV